MAGEHERVVAGTGTSLRGQAAQPVDPLRPQLAAAAPLLQAWRRFTRSSWLLGVTAVKVLLAPSRTSTAEPRITADFTSPEFTLASSWE